MDQNAAAAAGVAVLGVACVFLVIGLVIVVFFFLTLQKALGRCRPRNRTMEPAMVWLNLIPIFNLYWWFHTVINIGHSLKGEFIDRDLDDGGDYGKTLGIWMMVCNIGSSIISNVSQAARFDAGVFIAMPISIAAFVLFVVYWVRIAGYSKQLAHDDHRDDDRRDDDDDYEDDRPRRPVTGPKSTDIKSREKDDRYS